MTIKNFLDVKIYTALITRLKTMSGGYDIVEPGQTYPTEADTAFIVVQDVRFEPTMRYVGDTEPDENRGLINLSVMVPLAWDHQELLSIVGLIRQHFPKSLRLTYDDARVEILRTPFVDGNARHDESWNRVEVQVRWRCSG